MSADCKHSRTRIGGSVTEHFTQNQGGVSCNEHMEVIVVDTEQEQAQQGALTVAHLHNVTTTLNHRKESDKNAAFLSESLGQFSQLSVSECTHPTY